MVHIRELEEFAKDNHVPIMLSDGIEFLCNYIKENNIKSVLEIGSAIGYSSIMMCLNNEKTNITTIEKSIDMYNIALNNIDKYNLTDRINIINADALDVELDDKYDLIFIDAAKSQYIKFFEKFEKNLNKNGVIITDNLSFHGLVEKPELTNNRNTKQLVRKIKKYIDFIKENNKYETEFYSIGDGISVSRRINNE